MRITLDPSSPTPVYEEIVGQVRGAILRGEVSPGDRLPAARELASALGVNRNTVLRAYSALRDEGLLHLRPGLGAVVTDLPLDDAEWNHALTHLLAVARRLGMPLDHVHDAIDQHAKEKP